MLVIMPPAMKSPLARSARKYLLSFDNVDDKLIDSHLQNWKSQKKSTMSGIFKTFLQHAKNRQAMPNTIGDIEKLAAVLFGYDARKVTSTYLSHTDLLQEILRKKVKTPTPIDISNPRSHWVIYAKSVISSAKFLQSFKNAAAFHQFVESFYCNAQSRFALPLLLKEEIDGFGFALACDFLKESGYSGFVKPDTHLNDICRAAGITSATTDFGVFKDVVAYCEDRDLIPYEFDKLVWLVGSGDFYLKKMKVNSNKTEFISLHMKHG
jgi:hypothetical protein